LKINESLKCPRCDSENFEMKHEATYLYTYKIDTANSNNNNNNNDESENLPFLFENREQTSFKEYIECHNCGNRYPCSFHKDSQTIDLTIMKKAIRADNVDKTEVLG
jgi:DNA-directed RNA polymerase subunit M/transcription elongation factor TFIIS